MSRGTSVQSNKLLFKQVEEITGFRVISTSPPIEEVVGGSKGKIGCLSVRTIWTYRNTIGIHARDRVIGKGIIFAENGETVTYTLRGIGELLRNFNYRVVGKMTFKVHSAKGRLAYLDGIDARFRSYVPGQKRILTKVWIPNKP